MVYAKYVRIGDVYVWGFVHPCVHAPASSSYSLEAGPLGGLAGTRALYLTTAQLNELHLPLGNVSASAQCPLKDTSMIAETQSNHKVNPGVRDPEELTEVLSTYSMKACC